MGSDRKYAEKILRREARKSLGKRAADVEKLMECLQAEHDPELLHEMRIAVRRFRFSLEVFKGCFRKKDYKELSGRVATLQDAAGKLRDLDVITAFLRESMGEMNTPAVISENRTLYYNELLMIIANKFNNNYLSNFISSNL